MARILGLFFIVSLIFLDSVNAQELSIYTENNPPGSYLDKGKPAGMAVEIVREILRRLNQPDNIQIVPWSRGYQLALTKPNVVLFSTTRLPQREKLFKWVGPLYTQMWGFYAKKGTNLHITSLDDARKIPRIGTYRNDAKEQFLQAKGFSNLISANENTINVKHLLKGSIDLWLSSDFNMPYIARQIGVDPKELELVYEFRTVHNFIAFSIHTPDKTVSAWQHILDEIKKDGTYSRLSTK